MNTNSLDNESKNTPTQDPSGTNNELSKSERLRRAIDIPGNPSDIRSSHGVHRMILVDPEGESSN